VTLAVPSPTPLAPRGGTVTGTPALILRAEGAALHAASLAAYAATGGSWWLFAALFLAPDLFMLGYAVNARLGAALYNLGHTTVVPLALVLGGWLFGAAFAISLGLIWLGHVGFDRLMGYGLKYPSGFGRTHLG
jgi:hypothetical protein